MVWLAEDVKTQLFLEKKDRFAKKSFFAFSKKEVGLFESDLIG